MITLTDEERRRFDAFLLQEIQTSKSLIEQMKKINIPQHMFKIEENYIAACMTLHVKFVKVEVQTISGSKNES